MLSGVQELSCAALVQDKSCIPIETAAQRKRSGTGCKSISAQGVQDLSCVALVQDKSCIPIETAAQRKRSGTGCKPIPAQYFRNEPMNIVVGAILYGCPE